MVGAKMNASELADLIGMCGDGGYNQDAATMLRQQQAEIGALKQIIDANNLNQNIGQFVKPTNEPVAELVLEQMAVGDASSLRAKWLTDSYPLLISLLVHLRSYQLQRWLFQSFFL